MSVCTVPSTNRFPDMLYLRLPRRHHTECRDIFHIRFVHTALYIIQLLPYDTFTNQALNYTCWLLRTYI